MPRLLLEWVLVHEVQLWSLVSAVGTFILLVRWRTATTPRFVALLILYTCLLGMTFFPNFGLMFLNIAIASHVIAYRFWDDDGENPPEASAGDHVADSRADPSRGAEPR